ncbi:MAG: ATP-binding protein [Magnetococcales bacterium]|nr:ATP-binding protein [Magnetococcales bacterium]
MGRPYQRPPHTLYIAGEGIPNDDYFVGRQRLLADLLGLWRQPGGKPAVVLMGQRRIGKTSLLNKIVRYPLAEVGLLPVKTTIQGINTAHDFWQESAYKMADSLGVPRPTLEQNHPFVGFKAFLRQVQPDLGKRRFLLMVDEADLIPRQGLGSDFPGFLRTLMQEAEYPVLLLFCGTHLLKKLGREYDSIFFNTAVTFPVSYLEAIESREVLEKPAREYLEFSPLALDTACEITHGQPYLLQKIGQTIQSRFNNALAEGEQRTNYVTVADMNAAIQEVLELDTNAAFDNHWGDLKAADHRVLATLAKLSDESTRIWRTTADVEAFMNQAGMPLPRDQIQGCLEARFDEQILLRNGPAYKFSVPLYRQWIAWRWPPEVVREEALDSSP